MKKTYTVVFEFFGKKMRTKVTAENEAEVRYLILGKVKFHSIEVDKQSGDDVLNNLMDMFGMS